MNKSYLYCTVVLCCSNCHNVVFTPKGSVSRDFFHDSSPSGPLINRLKYFRIWFQLSPLWDAYCGDHLQGMMHTAEIDFAVGYTPRSFFSKLEPLTQRYDPHRRDCLRSIWGTQQRLSPGSKFWEQKLRVGHPFFSKERNVLAFFPVLYKRTECFFCSFPFFIKE